MTFPTGWSGLINDVTHVISEWGTIFIVTGDRQIFQLEEKDTATKMEMVFSPFLIGFKLYGPCRPNHISPFHFFFFFLFLFSFFFSQLFKKNLYVVAMNLAHSSQYDHASIVEINRKYADHLYSKGDFDAAMAQYIKTIGRLEPSYVIRKVCLFSSFILLLWTPFIVNHYCLEPNSF